MPEGPAPAAAGPPDEPPTLLGVVAGPRQLGQVDGHPVELISVELRSDRFLVDLHTEAARHTTNAVAEPRSIPADRPHRMQWSPAPSMALLARDAAGTIVLE
ncbi:MAG TPA: hypothetical protein VHF06_09675, partial [Pseudonocardiaceae bacterium]|nr:hypothetical protein [Pseudonocardiaceae bacterium]